MFSKIYDKVKKFIKNYYISIIIIGIILFMFFYEFPFIIYKSGGTINLDNRIKTDVDYKQEGSLKMSYVTAMKGTSAFILLSYILPDWDLYPLEKETGNNSYEEVFEIGREYLSEGIDNAIIAAFNESDYEIKIISEVNSAIYFSEEAKTNIKIGDQIIKINDINVSSLDEIKKVVNSCNEGDKVKVLVKNNNKEYERTATLYRDKDETLKMGVAFHTRYNYETEIPININMKNNESGSSGGLMMSLAVYNALTEEDITKGLNIVGTGSINASGTVEEIGGVKYKVLGAAKNNADIFFCPEENYKEAMKIKKERKLKLDVIKVRHLKDAINYLNEI